MMTQSFEIVFSDQRNLVYTILQSTYNKVPPKKLSIVVIGTDLRSTGKSTLSDIFGH